MVDHDGGYITSVRRPLARVHDRCSGPANSMLDRGRRGALPTYGAGEAWRKALLPFSGCSRRRISLI